MCIRCDGQPKVITQTKCAEAINSTGFKLGLAGDCKIPEKGTSISVFCFSDGKPLKYGQSSSSSGGTVVAPPVGVQKIVGFAGGSPSPSQT
jgi:hypothetical protein